jgi:hypothetical protein
VSKELSKTVPWRARELLPSSFRSFSGGVGACPLSGGVFRLVSWGQSYYSLNELLHIPIIG